MKKKTNVDQIFELFKKNNDDIKEIKKELSKNTGSNNFCIVKEIKYKKKTSVAKLIRTKDNSELCNYSLFLNMRNVNIIKIKKIYKELIDEFYYYLIIKEKAILKDMEKLTHHYHKNNLLKLIYNPFVDSLGDNLLRFFLNQIIDGLNMIYTNNIIHLNINPSNILVTANLTIKLSSFSNAIEYKENDDKNKIIIVPKADKGYISPEYHINSSMSIEDAKKQDYFALGSTLFYFMFGEKLINSSKKKEPIIDFDIIINRLEKRINFIKSRAYLNKGLIALLCSLINYKSKDRLSFDKIRRNKWLNENRDYIESIFNSIYDDEEKLILELQKSDFLYKKEKEMNYCNTSKFKFKKSKKVFIKVKTRTINNNYK